MSIQKLEDSSNVLPKTRDQLIQKAMKLKALADRGETGEQETAASMLADLMQKHNITWSDLDDTIESMYTFPCENEYHKRLLVQIVYTHLGSGHCYRAYSSDNTELSYMKIKCRPRDFIEIKLDWEFYWIKLQEEFELFYRAFVEQNHLFPPDSLQKEDDSDDNETLSEAEILKLKRMMQGIDSYTRHLMIEETAYNGGSNG